MWDGLGKVWDELFRALSAADPYGRQMSIHNGALLYNHSQPWITHVSIQGREETTADLRATYGKPLIWDEVRTIFGSISASPTACPLRGYGRAVGDADIEPI